MARQSTLPPTLAPRLVCREAAAAYVSLSPSKFDDLVRLRVMPAPKRLSERRLAWDVRGLDTAVDNLPTLGGDIEDNSWSDVDAT